MSNGSGRIAADVLAALGQARCDGNMVYLPTQLPRKLYEHVNEVLEHLGGTWKGGKTKAHVFEADPATIFAECLATGIMPPRNPLAFFETPAAEAAYAVSLLDGTADFPCEPSAGNGAIVRELLARYPDRKITAVEYDAKLAAGLRHDFRLVDDKTRGVHVIQADFLTLETFFDAYAMNPPFAVDRDPHEYIAHILHAWAWLLPGGALAAFAPASLCFRNDTRVKRLRELVEAHGRIEKLPEGTFQAAGTLVKTVLVYMRKPPA